MKNIYTIILFIALTIPIRLCCAQKESAFYTLPEGAFIGTVTEQGIVGYASSIYIPYSAKGHTWTSVDPQRTGQWKITGRNDVMGGYYTSIDPMNSTYTIPQLEEINKISYQYGAIKLGSMISTNYVHIGDSVSHYMTPARLICDHAQTLSPNTYVYNLVKTPSYFTKNFDTIGVYFNNIDVMYIEGIRIPIEGETKENLFPQQDSSIKVTIYPAKAIGGKTANIADKSRPLAKVTLGKEDFIANNKAAYMGTLQATLSKPITIKGPFVVELTGMKTSGCNFYVTASREREGENYWGYHIEGNKETYHNKFTPAISVNAMFPALYSEEGEDLEIVIPAEGIDYTNEECPQRTIYANMSYKKGEKGFSSSEIEWCKIFNMGTTQDHVTFAFTAEANTNNNPREADFVFSFRGKSLNYHLYQPPQGRTVVRNGLTKGNLGTICLPYEVKEVTGASLWEIAYLTNNTLVLEEAKTIEAGLPYIFQAEQERIEGIIMTNLTTTMEQKDANNGLAGAKNGLHGTLETIRDKALEGKYVMANNEFVRCGSGCELGANRAYMVLEEVPTTETPAKEGVRRMAMKMGEVTELEFRMEESVERSKKHVPLKLYGADGRLYISVNGQVIGMDGQVIGINGQRIW